MFFLFARVIVFAVEEFFGVSPTQDHSNLADMDKADHLKGFKGDWQEVITKIVDNFNEIHVKSVNRLSIFNYWFLNIVFLSKTPIKSQNQFFLTIPA